MKYLIGLALSGMLFLGTVGTTVDFDFWQKILYNKERPKEKRRRERKIDLIIWAILTIAEFIFIIVFWH